MEYIGNIDEDFILFDSNDIIIFGAGTLGKKVFDFLAGINKESRVRYFCDNNSKMWGKEWFGVLIKGFNDIKEEYPRATYVIASKYVRSISQQLYDTGIERVHIIKF